VVDVVKAALTRVRQTFSTVRARTTSVAVIVVAAALVVAAVAMVVLLRRSLAADVGDAAQLRAQAVADGLVSVAQNFGIPAAEDDEEFVQLLDANGRVVSSSSNLEGAPAVAPLRPGESRVLDSVSLEDNPFLAVAISAKRSSGSLTVIAGRTLESVSESTHAVVRLLIIGLPILLLVVGATTWLVVGRALRPVEAIRSEVEAISTAELHRRVPDPPGKDEISRLAATMNRMLGRLEEGQARQRRFVSDASHELRSPVTTIREHAEVALAHPDGTRVEELAQVVLEEDIRLQRLVEDLLLLAKIDEGTLQLRTAPVDLDDLLFEEAERLRRTSALRTSVAGVSAGRVSGNPEQLRKLIRNLTDNAARHARSTIALSLKDGRGGTLLAVDDDGDGIPPAERERIFERFVRRDEARDRDSGGSGLGLAIVVGIAAAHGAAVTVLDSPLGGARFEVRFPPTRA
jgi:signal transduction histidine kinase